MWNYRAKPGVCEITDEMLPYKGAPWPSICQIGSAMVLKHSNGNKLGSAGLLQLWAGHWGEAGKSLQLCVNCYNCEHDTREKLEVHCYNCEHSTDWWHSIVAMHWGMLKHCYKCVSTVVNCYNLVKIALGWNNVPDNEL